MANVPAPIDVTQTSEWKALQKHFDKLKESVTLKQLFANDPQRVRKLSFEGCTLTSRRTS